MRCEWRSWSWAGVVLYTEDGGSKAGSDEQRAASGAVPFSQSAGGWARAPALATPAPWKCMLLVLTIHYYTPYRTVAIECVYFLLAADYYFEHTGQILSQSKGLPMHAGHSL